jgi:SAM-dependent methyltransferase
MPSSSPELQVNAPTITHDEEKKDDEREVWEFMTPLAWHNSVSEKDSIFVETYECTRKQMTKMAEENGYDVVIEVGCGTGDVIGEMPTTIPRIGLDINEEFIGFCKQHHVHENCEFYVADALCLTEWWESMGFDKLFKKPLVTCINNTLNIMPEHLRGAVVDQMINLAGDDGLCMVTYWNGNFFSHAVMNYYKKNEPLCGKFSVHQHVDWDTRHLVTPTNYSTEWHIPQEVQQLLRAYDVDVPNHEPEPLYNGQPHLNCDGLAIFVWFNESSTSRAKGYYDSDDAQKFYHNIWGEDNLHVGRYDLLSPKELAGPVHQQVALAQERHEEEFVKLIKNKTLHGDTESHGLRVVDLGCGYAGLLRRLYKDGLVWHGTGVDISSRMCHQSRLLNTTHGCDPNIDIKEESYLDVSMPDECADLVISMDAFLHVGPERQRRAIEEAARLLRPGGWIIFSDIMQEEKVDAKEMQPIYDRIHLTKMGTVSNYQSALEECGFTDFSMNAFSENIPMHYSKINEVLAEKGPQIGISEDYMTKATKGLATWTKSAPNNVAWGFVTAQKTKKVPLRSVVKKVGA